MQASKLQPLNTTCKDEIEGIKRWFYKFSFCKMRGGNFVMRKETKWVEGENLVLMNNVTEGFHVFLFSLYLNLILCLDILKSTERSGMEQNGMKWNYKGINESSKCFPS